MATTKNEQNPTNAGEYMEQLELYTLLERMQKKTVILENSSVVSFKIKYTHTVWRNDPLLGIYSREIKTCSCK